MNENSINNTGQTINNVNIIPQQPINNGNNVQNFQPTNQNAPHPTNNFISGTPNNVSYMNQMGNVATNQQPTAQINPQPIAPNNQPINIQNNQINNMQNTQPLPDSNNNIVDNSNNNNMINNLNIDGSYNGIQAPEYVNEPLVRENITPKKKNTITITKELKTVIIIALVLLVFIIIMPILFDLLNNVRYH